MAAAIGSSISATWRAPADRHASSTARVSTSVTPGGDAHDHPRARPAARLRLAQEVAQHLLGDLEVGDHPVAQRPCRGDRGGGAADHPVRLVADGVDLAAIGVDGDHRRLGDDDAAAALVDERVRGAEVDGEVAVAERHQPTTSAKAPCSTVMRCIPSSSRTSPSTLNSVPGGRSTSITWPRAWHTLRCSAIVPRRRPHARRARAEARAGGQHGGVEHPVVGIGGADLGAAAEVAGDRDDRLPGLAREDLGAVRAHRAAQRLLRRGRPDRAERVGERAELRLQRLGTVRRGGGEPGARDVDERAPVGEAPELERPQPLARGGQHARLLGVERQLRGAREVVGRPHRDHRQRHSRGARRARRSRRSCRRRRPPRSARAPSSVPRRGPRGWGRTMLTSAPWRRIVATSGWGSKPPPEASLAISAMRTPA